MTSDQAREDEPLRQARAAPEAAWRAAHGPLGPTVGEQYFVDLSPDAEYDEGQRQAIRDIRGTLARLRPSHVRPERTHRELDTHGYYLRLHIPHASDPDVSLDLVYGDGYLSLKWPGGEEHDGWVWSPLLALVVEALLAGRNEQVVYSRLGRVYAVDTAIWDEGGQRFQLRREWRPRQLLAALTPIPSASHLRRSISFDRELAMLPA